MEPNIVTREAFTVLGFQERFTSETEDFEGVWNRFMAFHNEISALSTDGAYYGVSFVPDDVQEGEAMEYVAGMAVGELADVPEGLVLREVPSARCAVFACAVETIHQTYEHIFHQWLPESQCEADHPLPNYEHYPPATARPDSPVFIYIPIREKGSG
jgi:predicted transcriptional regulator YdeE